MEGDGSSKEPPLPVPTSSSQGVTGVDQDGFKKVLTGSLTNRMFLDSQLCSVESRSLIGFPKIFLSGRDTMEY